MPGFKINIDDNCGVTADTGPSNVVETARRHRFNLEILEPLGDRDNGLLLFGYKCNRPSIEFDEILIHNAQDDIGRPGKQHWKPIDFTFYEVLRGEKTQYDQAAELIYKWWAKTMINVETSLHNPPDAYLKNCRLDMLDGAGKPVWSYGIYDAWPMKVSPSELDYGDSTIADITVTLRYAKAREQRVLGEA